MVTGDRERQDSWAATPACAWQLVRLRLNAQVSLAFTCSCMFFGRGFPRYFGGSV